jgi:hypothetical protein
MTIGWIAATPSVHPVLRLLLHAANCLDFMGRWMNHWLHVDSSGATTPVLAYLSLVHTDRIDRRLKHPDCRFIWCYCLLWADHFFFSWIHPVLLEIGPSDHPTMFFSSIFCLSLDPQNIYYLLILACDIFAFLGLGNVYKDMLNNMINLIGHLSWIAKIKLEQTTYEAIFARQPASVRSAGVSERSMQPSRVGGVGKEPLVSSQRRSCHILMPRVKRGRRS